MIRKGEESQAAVFGVQVGVWGKEWAGRVTHYFLFIYVSDLYLMLLS